MNGPRPMKIVLCGPPHSGKSCLRNGLKEAIRGIAGAPYPYVITAVPDGEGSWYQETAGANPDLAAEIKRANKAEFTDSQADKFEVWVNRCEEPLVFIDIGGIADDKNIRICKGATHAILIAGNTDALEPWWAFCRQSGLEIIAELHSDYPARRDVLFDYLEDGIFRASVHHLERGDLTIRARPAVQALSECIVTQLVNWSNQMSAYHITFENGVLVIGFGDPAQNDEILRAAVARLKTLTEDGTLAGGEIVRINGPASLPVAMAIAHSLAHLYQAVACYDPKLSRYVVAISHGDKYHVGDLVS